MHGPCQQIAVEKDHHKSMQLAHELHNLIERKEHRQEANPPEPKQAPNNQPYVI